VRGRADHADDGAWVPLLACGFWEPMPERDGDTKVARAALGPLRRASLAVAIFLVCVCCSSAEPALRVPRVERDEFSIVVPLLDDPEGAISADLIYEGNNSLFRAGSTPGRDGPLTGMEIAARWRVTAERTRAIFVLRDSLWNEQDHPTRHRPVSIMLPPSWLILAAMEEDPKPVLAFELEDDAAWRGVRSANEMFGSYPPSGALFRLATQATTGPVQVDRERVLSARSSLTQLSDHTRRLQRAAAKGRRALVSEGAEIIAAGDRAYFGESTRRDHVIPIFVENPRDFERVERKGWMIPGLEIEPELARSVVTQICRRRLNDGDIALERYDLSDPRATERALRILEWTIPSDEPGSTNVWLWVTGKLEPVKHQLVGEGALHYVEPFLEQARHREINLDRLKLFNKPAESVADDAFGARAGEYHAASLYMSVEEGTTEVLDAMEAAGR
jgi:hypothetical protein